ncbi:unnamed protein product [Microthlaspi erraticum]|uniref:F-box domain-containing protein n=1 Tax=Microthlaspi erraticum TaxID=1685480 RepID=A0A6D2L8V1_9BRAS|nr:unnamed protein product [Microthlaspi erraticum]
MIRAEVSDPIPIDLVNEILSRLPAKSVRRFRCVSKQWGSMLRRPYFTELFLTRSRSRPRLLFLLEGDDQWNIYSSPQTQNTYEKSSLVVAADFNKTIRGKTYEDLCGYASGLIYFPEGTYGDAVFNPNTGEYAILPEVEKYRKSTSFLGFDPFGKQFKVLAEGFPFCVHRDHHKTLTLGTGKLRWRSKKGCPRYNNCCSEGICINGVLYYLASTETLGDIFLGGSDDQTSYVKIVCFDVRSEKFKFIDTKGLCGRYTTGLVNYKGKLGGISWKYAKAGFGRRTLELRMWVLEDVEKQEWSNHDYSLSDGKIVDDEVFVAGVFVAGVTSTGEIVLSMREPQPRKPFYVFYFNPERNTLQSVEIQGFGEHLGKVKKVFVDHVEDLTLNIMKTSLPERKREATSTSTSSESHLQQDGQEQKRKPKRISTCSKAHL